MSKGNIVCPFSSFLLVGVIQQIDDVDDVQIINIDRLTCFMDSQDRCLE